MASEPPDSSASGLPDELNLLTLNCWGLLHISALRTERLARIGHELATRDPPPHIVCLQECWTQDDYRAVRRATAAALPHGKFYHSGAFGGGLAILSRWPLEESSMVPYPLNGRPTAFWRGDWYVGKGVACASVRYGPGRDDVIEVFNTHTHAPYEKEPNDSYLCHRTAQAWEIAKLLRRATSRGRLALALGDFNMLPLSLAHRLITGHAPVADVWRVLRPDSALGPAHHPAERARQRDVPGALYNLTYNGAASDGPFNTWRWSKAKQKRLRAGDPCPVDNDAPDPLGKRLDYIFASCGSGPDDANSGWVVTSAEVTMTQRHPDLLVSLSDHFGVSATLRRHTITNTLPTPSPDNNSTLDSPQQSSDWDAQIRSFQKLNEPLPTSVYDEILAMTQSYTTRERKQRYWRGVHFWVALVVWIGCLVAVWFSPANFVAFILMLVSSLGLASGVVDGLLALLFFSSELRTLKEFEWEIRNARAIANGESLTLANEETESKVEAKGEVA